MPFFDFQSFQLFYYDSGSPLPGAPVITFVHGFTASLNVYKNQIQYFSPKYRVIALDLLGHGESSRPDPAIAAQWYTHNGFLESIVALLDYLSIQRTTILGWSMGTGAAMELARRYPERVDNLVLIGASPLFLLPTDEPTFPGIPKSVADAVLESMRTQYREFYYGFVFGWFPDYVAGELPPKYIEDALDDAATMSGKTAYSILSQVGPEDFRDRTSEVKTRALIVQGGKDSTIPTEAARWLYNHLSGEKEWTFYENEGHAPFLGPNTDKFNADLERFLQLSN